MRDRIKELRRVRASELVPNPKNWRKHPEEQRKALQAMLQDVGFAGAQLARELPDGRLMLIDGHARALVAGDAEVPVLVLDVSEAEADKILLTFDPLSQMATADEQLLRNLVTSVDVDDDAVKSMLSALAEQLPDDVDAEAAKAELEAASTAYSEYVERRKDSIRRGDDKAEVNFWVCLVFQSWDQKQQFLKCVEHVPTLYGMYVDGQVMAEACGFAVDKNTQKPIQSPLDKKLAALVSPDV